MKVYKTGPTTRDLEHRAMTLQDAEAFFALNSNVEVMRHTGEPPLQSLDDARNAIENYPDFERFGYGRWRCFLKDTETMIGFCGLKCLDDLRCVDVGFRFLPEYWGRGFATQACRASLEYGFEVIGLERIVGLVLPENPASSRVLEKCGMRNMGQFEYEEFEPYLFEITR